MKTRHAVYSLGDLAANSYSNEVDLGTFSHAWIYFRLGSDNTNTIRVQAAPEEIGETPTWYTFGKDANFSNPNARVCAPLPLGVGTDYLVPARLRVWAQNPITDLYIEGIRDLP